MQLTLCALQIVFTITITQKLLVVNPKNYNDEAECDLLGKRRKVTIERMTDDIIDERKTSRDVFSCPVTEVQVQQTLISAYISRRNKLKRSNLHQNFHLPIHHIGVVV